MRKILFVIILLQLQWQAVFAQQVPDLGFQPVITTPAYPISRGPSVLVDEAHHNFHTISTRYNAFAKVLSGDGYNVRPNTAPFSSTTLTGAKILVIANAVHATNVSNWWLPTPSAFTSSEIDAVEAWVKNGGSLFLIADHMPFPGAAGDLAKRFGFTFYNGFVTDTTAGLFPGAKRELDVFYKKTGTLKDVPVSKSKGVSPDVDQVATFTGQGFQIPSNAISLLTFDERYKILIPDTAWKFNSHTTRIPIKGFSQGAIVPYGKGKVAVFGEAAMFTAQLKGTDKNPFGLNSPDAEQNLPFLLNVIHWLDL